MAGSVDPRLAGRDLAVDAARVAALAFVVCAHILLVTLVTDPATGGVSNVMVPTLYPWFWWVTCLVQIMPLFFVVGGYASAVSWNRARSTHHGRDSTSPAGWVRARLLKLAQPAAALWVFLALAYGAARVVGAPSDYVNAALPGIGMHLWFLGAYGLCMAAVPLTTAAHRRRPYLSLGVLLAAVVMVELIRVGTGQPWWGLLGLGPVWVAIHQLGYLRADGTFGRCPPWLLVVMAAAGYLGLAVLTSMPAWSRDMLTNLNPPTMALFLLGLSQACLLQLLTPLLDRLMRHKPIQTVAWVIGSRPVTLYLWHLPVIVCVMAVWWLVGGPEPAVDSAAWWLWRVPLAAICWVAVLAVVPLAGSVEARSSVDSRSPVTWLPVLIALVLVVVPAVLEIRFLFTPWLVLGGAVAHVVAVGLLRRVRPPARRHGSPC
ncbi:acyltransferase [Kocuria sp. ZOR0020]|uniref:acyltransferase family protein n=1 Tax=Kocuria sp. ZOR0020 TaxID=1339234 RepID=UPI00068B8C5E|nr:acyltransferase [Kocuria sp. ZOR0020]